MADAPDLGSGSERIGGSSPLARTTLDRVVCATRAGGQLFELNGEKTASSNLRQIGFVNETAVIFIFQQMLAKMVLLAANQELEFIEIGGPSDSVEEFRAGKLSFVERILAITGAQVEKLKIAFRKQPDRARHHEHAEIPAVVVEVVERVIVVRHRARLEVKCRHADLRSSPGIGED